MPDMTGLQLQRELLNLGVRIPTIVITAVEDEHIGITAKSLGAAAFLSEPVSKDLLIAAIDIAAAKPN